uniref:Uncharacterized protein n=1 Tax=Hemiselmis tepida TaxID=464990 RepID=A0A7S0VYM0_9CRYP
MGKDNKREREESDDDIPAWMMNAGHDEPEGKSPKEKHHKHSHHHHHHHSKSGQSDHHHHHHHNHHHKKHHKEHKQHHKEHKHKHHHHHHHKHGSDSSTRSSSLSAEPSPGSDPKKHPAAGADPVFEGPERPPADSPATTSPHLSAANTPTGGPLSGAKFRIPGDVCLDAKPLKKAIGPEAPPKHLEDEKGQCQGA